MTAGRYLKNEGLNRAGSRSRGPWAGVYLDKPEITRKPVAGVEWSKGASI